MSCSRTQRSDAAEVGKVGIIAYTYSLLKCTSAAIQEGGVGRGLNTWLGLHLLPFFIYASSTVLLETIVSIFVETCCQLILGSI